MYRLQMQAKLSISKLNAIVNQLKGPKQPISAPLEVINDLSSLTKCFNLKEQVSNAAFAKGFIYVWIMSLSCNFLCSEKKLPLQWTKHSLTSYFVSFLSTWCHFTDWRVYTQNTFCLLNYLSRTCTTKVNQIFEILYYFYLVV